MATLTTNDWTALRRIIALFLIAWVWSYRGYSTSFPLEHYRSFGLGFITAGICLFLYWGGKNPCILWRHEFGDSLGVTIFEKIIAPIAPIWFVKFPILDAHDLVKTISFADTIMALLLFLVMFDYGGYQGALFKKIIEDRIELSFRELGLGYPPTSKLATFLVFCLLYVFGVAMILTF